MATLIAVYDSDGLVGRCDAHCYNAQHPDCHCVCGGKNHGAGLKQATENTREYAQSMLDKIAEGSCKEDLHAELGKGIAQAPLIEAKS